MNTTASPKDIFLSLSIFQKESSLLLCVNFFYHEQKFVLLLNSIHIFFFVCLAITGLSLISFSHPLVMSVLMIVLCVGQILIVLHCDVTVISFLLLKLQLHNFISRLCILVLMGLSRKVPTSLYHTPVRFSNFVLH